MTFTGPLFDLDSNNPYLSSSVLIAIVVKRLLPGKFDELFKCYGNFTWLFAAITWLFAALI